MENKKRQTTRPIRYAAMPIYEVCGFNSLNDREYEKIGYIATPCYLMKESIVYLDDNKKEMEYEIVFAKDNKRLFEKDNEKVPNYNFEGVCLNSDIVKNISTDFITMKNYCDQLNCKYKSLSTIGIKEEQKRKQKEEEYEETMKQYYQLIGINLEQTYLDKTELSQLDIVERIVLLNDFKVALNEGRVDQEVLEEYNKKYCQMCTSQRCKGALEEQYNEGCLQLAFYVMKKLNNEESYSLIKQKNNDFLSSFSRKK